MSYNSISPPRRKDNLRNVRTEQGGEEDGNAPGPRRRHYGEDRISKSIPDTEETNKEEKNGHLDRNDGKRVKYFIAPV